MKALIGTIFFISISLFVFGQKKIQISDTTETTRQLNVECPKCGKESGYCKHTVGGCPISAAQIKIIQQLPSVDIIIGCSGGKQFVCCNNDKSCCKGTGRGCGKDGYSVYRVVKKSSGEIKKLLEQNTKVFNSKILPKDNTIKRAPGSTFSSGYKRQAANDIIMYIDYDSLTEEIKSLL